MPTRHDDAISGIRHAHHAILQFERALGRQVNVHLADVALLRLLHLVRHVLPHELVALFLQLIVRYHGHVADLLPLRTHVMCIVCVQVRSVLADTRLLFAPLLPFLLIPHVPLEIEAHVGLLTLVLLLELPYPLLQIIQVFELRPLEVSVSQLPKEGRCLEFVDFELPLWDGQQAGV